MNYLQIILLAVIQGAAELLPVSSSAHVIVAERLMGLDPGAPDMTFLLVMLHTGTMFAVLVYFWPRWRARLRPAGRQGAWRFLAMAILATACTGVLGLALKTFIERVVLVGMLHHERGEVEHLFRSLPLIAAALFAAGILIIAAGTREQRGTSEAVSSRAAVGIGLVQGLCLPFRGFSRSGATISTGLFFGQSRALAEDFSFVLAVLLTPPVVVLELRRLLKAPDWQAHSLGSVLAPGLIGMVFSFVAGLLALRILSAALERGRWRYFGFYCLAAAAVIAFLASRLGPP